MTLTGEQTAALLAGGDRHATSQTGILATLERLGLSDPETAVIGRNLRAMLQARPARRGACDSAECRPRGAIASR